MSAVEPDTLAYTGCAGFMMCANNGPIRCRATVMLDDPVIASRHIDRVLAAGSHVLSSTRHDPNHLQEFKP